MQSLLSQLGYLLPAVIAFSLLLVLRDRQSIRVILEKTRRESILNIQLFLFNIFFVITPITAVAGFTNTFIVSNNLVLLSQPAFSNWNPLLILLLTVFIGDLIGYWRHRLEHSRVLWPSHAVHHSDTELTWFSLERFHPINRLTTIIIDSAFLTVAGLPIYAVLLNSLIRHYYGYFIHANLPWTYGVLGKIFVSPAMHRWHHSKNKIAYNKNFATVFSCIDLLFGTYYVPGPCNSKLGVTDKMGTTLLGQLTYAFRPSSYRRQ